MTTTGPASGDGPTPSPCLYVVAIWGWADDAAHPHVDQICGPYPDEDAADAQVDAVTAAADGWQRVEVHPLHLPPAPADAVGLVLGSTPVRPDDVAVHPVTGWRWTFAPRPADRDRPWVMTTGPWTCLGQRYTDGELAGLGARLLVRNGQLVTW